MRVKSRRKVDLPQPEGQIKAVTERSGTSRPMSNSACLEPYQNDSPATLNLERWPALSGALRPPMPLSEMMAEYERVDTVEPRGATAAAIHPAVWANRL